MKNWHNWATMVENWKFQDAVMLYIYIYIYIIYIIYIIYQLKSFCWSELQIEVMAKTENLKSLMITELLKDVITNLKRLKIWS